jgi:hypothetical protein
MQVPNYYMAQRLHEAHEWECERKAARRLLLEQAGVDRRSWLEAKACAVLAKVGCLLVALGRKMERLAPAPASSPARRLPGASGA